MSQTSTEHPLVAPYTAKVTQDDPLHSATAQNTCGLRHYIVAGYVPTCPGTSSVRSSGCDAYTFNICLTGRPCVDGYQLTWIKDGTHHAQTHNTGTRVDPTTP